MGSRAAWRDLHAAFIKNLRPTRAWGIYMIYQLIRYGSDLSFIKLIFMFMSYALIILLALPVHELAHAYTAYRLGDNTAKWNGRLTLNPFAHLDIIGTILIFVFGFGYAKPVPVNPRNFRNYKTGMLLTSLAGPLSNLVMGFLSLAILRLLSFFALPVTMYGVLYLLLDTFVYINIVLAVFNLLPIPPLDGFRIVANFLPDRWSYFVDRYHWYISMALFLLIASDVFGGVISGIANPVYNLFYKILGFSV